MIEMRPHKECLYDVRWQTQRLRYAGRWNTRSQAEECVKSMLAYIGEIPVRGPKADGTERLCRVWRALNALAGFQAGASDEALRVIRIAIAGLKREHKKLKSLGFDYPIWDWQKVANDLDTLYYYGRSEGYERLRTTMEQRAKSARDDGGTQYRPELMRFLRLMREVDFEDAAQPHTLQDAGRDD